MILADKIINLRKKNGWSQEELAEMLGVSRQSISKYEGAQSIPDLDKVIKMSEIFGVSTDFLLRDDMEMEETVTKEFKSDNKDEEPVKVSMEEAQSFIQAKKAAAGKIAFATMMCILCPVVLILLSGFSETNYIALSENMAAGIGIITLLFMVAAAVMIFISTGSKLKRYEYLEVKSIDTEYGVSGAVKELKNKEESACTKQIMVGVALCILAAVPLFIAMTMESDFAAICGVCAVLLLVSIGVFLIVEAATKADAYKILLEEDDYSKENKAIKKKTAGVMGAYWSLAAVIFLAWSFITFRWDYTWIVWPIAGVLSVVVRKVAAGLLNK